MKNPLRLMALLAAAVFFLPGTASAEISASDAEPITLGSSDPATPLLEASRVRFKPG
jgi:hypothetical protein